MDVFMLRSVTVGYTRQYMSTKVFNGISFGYAAYLLYEWKYYGRTLKRSDYDSFQSLIIDTFDGKYPEIKNYPLWTITTIWIEKYSKSNRPSKYTRVHT